MQRSPQSEYDAPFPRDMPTTWWRQLNQCLSCARKTSDNAFAHMTHRFQLYNRILMMMRQRFKTVIQATIILHSFIEKNHKNRLLSTSNSLEWIRRRRNRASANNVHLNPPLGNGCHGSRQAITFTYCYRYFTQSMRHHLYCIKIRELFVNSR